MVVLPWPSGIVLVLTHGQGEAPGPFIGADSGLSGAGISCPPTNPHSVPYRFTVSYIYSWVHIVTVVYTMTSTKTSIEIDDLQDLKVFCTRRNLKLKQFVNRAIRNELERMGVEPEDSMIRIDTGVSVEGPKNAFEGADAEISKKEIGAEISGEPPLAVDKEVPRGYWKCPHCGALNEAENLTGKCSSCYKAVNG